VLGVLLMSIGRQATWVAAQIATAALKIGLNVLIIPVFESAVGNGALGASVVTIVIEIVVFVIAIVLIPKHFLELESAKDAAKIICAGVATVVAGTALLQLSPVVAILGGALAYFASTMLLRAITPGDIAYLRTRVLRANR
jgi:O-antigen/teichoic acid export membrane protein